jgi:hypothetical protein
MHSYPQHEIETSDQLHSPATLTSAKKATHPRKGGWLGLRANLDMVVNMQKRKS